MKKEKGSVHKPTPFGDKDKDQNQNSNLQSREKNFVNNKENNNLKYGKQNGDLEKNGFVISRGWATTSQDLSGSGLQYLPY